MSVAVLLDGRIVSGSKDKSVSVWDPLTGACNRVLKRHTSVSDRSYYYKCLLYYLYNLSVIYPFRYVTYIQYVYSVAVLPDGRIVSGSFDKTIRIWDANTGQCVRVFEGQTEVDRNGWCGCHIV